MKIKKILSVFLIIITVFSMLSIDVVALSWDGSSAGGSTNAVNGSATGYVIRSTNDSECVVGYRFSIVTSTGAMKVSKVIDIFRNTGNGNNAYSNSAKFSTKYNKKQLIAKKDSQLKTTSNTTNCYKESSFSFISALPNPSSVGTWQKYEKNLEPVISKLGAISIANLSYGDKVIIEPLFDVCLAGEYQALTVTEIAYCGRSVLGGSSSGGTPSYDSSKWGFIKNYTNKIWPNKLFTPDGQGLWTKASSLTDYASFDKLISYGYGAGIAYSETKAPVLTIAYDCKGSTVKITDTSKGFTLGTYNRLCSTTATHKTISGTTNVYYQSLTYNNKLGENGLHDFVTFGLSAPTGYKFKAWHGAKGDFNESSQYTAAQLSADIANGDATVWLTASFSPITYTVKYNGNGNTGGSTAASSHTYDTAKNLTANGFTKTGYTFNGWNTKADGSGTAYTNSKSVKNLSSTQGATVNLYAQWKPNTYTVSYNANGGTNAPASQTKTYGVNLTLSSSKPTRTGYTFKCWNTTSTGTGTNYSSGDTYTANANVTLYAQWQANATYTVTYNANGGSSAPGSQTKKENVSLTLSSSKPTRTGHTFVNWNTKSDGSGTTYNPGATYSSNANLYLYAQWKPNTYTVTYNANGGSNAPSAQTKTYGVNLTLSSSKPTRTGYTFKSWNTTSTGTGTTYSSGGTYTANANVTLYAQWTPITYTVTYNANGGSNAPASQTKAYGVSLTLSSTKPTRTGYSFVSWNTKSDGTGTNYSSGGTYTANASVTLYARWQPNTYTVSYNANGGSNAPASQTKTYGINLTLSSSKPTRTEYSFVSWNTKPDGSGTTYNPSSIYTANANVTLYAQWKEDVKLQLEAITPNAPYKANTDVISSFYLINSSTKQYTPDDNISVCFKVYKGSSLIKTVTLSKVVVPANDKNLIYFKWNVPAEIGNNEIKITGEIIDGNTSYGLISNVYETCKYTISATPDTQYEASSPAGFSVPTVPNNKSDSAIWSVWSYENGAFVKTNYGVAINDVAPVITPDTSANATFSNNIWTMKSGYGFGISVNNTVKSLSGYTMPNSDSYTVPQYSKVLFPEFSYLNTLNNYRTLELVSGNWIFRQNGTYGNIHFTPLWYPDTNYCVSVVQEDCWTPAGMISRQINSNNITISGSAYDDWYLS